MLSDLCGLGVFFFQAEDGIRDLVRSRGLGDVYKRQPGAPYPPAGHHGQPAQPESLPQLGLRPRARGDHGCLLYTSDAADERSSVDLGGRRIIQKKNLHDRRFHAGLTSI